MSNYSEGDPPASTDLDAARQVSLCEALDRILNKGVVVAGEVVISVAGIDLVYLNLQLLLSSIETACRYPRSTTEAPTTVPPTPVRK